MTQEESKLRECYRHIWVQAKELLKENYQIKSTKRRFTDRCWIYAVRQAVRSIYRIILKKIG